MCVALSAGEKAAGAPAYRTYDVMLTELRKIESDHPAICKLYDIGDSRGKEYFLQGRAAYAPYNHDLWALKVSRNVEKTEDEPAVLYCGEHHAREPISLEVTMAMLNRLAANYGKDSTVTRHVDSKEIWFVPLVNPDGHEVVISGLTTGWRKNIRDNDSSNDLTGSDGVDLNRNYGYAWGGASSSSSIEDESYRGPFAWSEPEVRAMKSLIDTCRFIAGISYHSYRQDVLYPYAYAADARAPDQASLADLARKMARTIPALGDTGGYAPLKWSDMYEAGGILDDYAYSALGTFMYTIELGVEFIAPPDSIERICGDNLQAAMLLLDRLDVSALAGHAYTVTESGRTPLTGQIYIKEIDDTIATGANFREAIKSNAAFGAYRRLLMPGSYTVTFRPDSASFAPITVNNATIKEDGITVLDFACTRSAVRNGGGASASANAFRAVKTGPHSVSFFIPPAGSQRILEIFSLTGKKVDRRPIAADARATIAMWDTQGFAAGVYVVKLTDPARTPAASLTVTLTK